MRLPLRSWKELTWTDVLILGTSVSTAAVALYLLMAQDEEELSAEMTNGSRQNNDQHTLTSRQTLIQVKIPKEAAGQVIGQQGIVIKQVQAESGARIHFKDEAETDTERILMVRGNQESAQKAEMMIKQIIHDIPEVHSLNIFVPQRFLGRLIGKNGDNIRNLQRSSKAKVVIERSSDEKDPKAAKKVTISGSAEQIDLARGQIEEQLEEDEAFRRKQQIAADARGKKTATRKSARNVSSNGGGKGDVPSGDAGENALRRLGGGGDAFPSSSLPPNGEGRKTVDGAIDEALAGDSDSSAPPPPPPLLPMKWPTVQLPDHGDYFEVYVSALDVKEANRVWIQLFSKADKLNLLNQRLSNFYNSRESENYLCARKGEGTSEAKRSKAPSGGEGCGDEDGIPSDRFVAAKLNAYDDSKWFRAKILSIKDELVEVFYVDYGDVALVSFAEVRRLRQDFASEIPFQAVECVIAGIGPPPNANHATNGVIAAPATVKPAPDDSLACTGVTNAATTATDAATTATDAKSLRDSSKREVGSSVNVFPPDDSIAEFVSQVIADVESLPINGTANSSTSDRKGRDRTTILYDSNGDEEIAAPAVAISKTAGAASAWTEAALDFMDEVTKNAQWILLYAKIVDHLVGESGRRIPMIELVDTNGDEDVDVATSVVQAGHAVWCRNGADET